MMHFKKVDETNVHILYALNQELACSENQNDLFTADIIDYSNAFIGNNSIAYGFLLYQEERAIGFYLFFYKFASYLGKKTLYIEDYYLTSEYRNHDYKLKILEHAVETSLHNNCCRIEMRVFKTANIDYDIIAKVGFKAVNKWDVYRMDHPKLN